MGAMIFCAAGDIHGALDRLYDDVLAFEASLGVRFAHVLHVGDFGIWPDPDRVDRATKNHDGAGDFPRWFAERRTAPRPTLFIKGNHEDFDWLEDLACREEDALRIDLGQGPPQQQWIRRVPAKYRSKTSPRAA